MAERLTKLKIFLRTPYYEINKGEKKKVANKLGVLEDILEKYNINSTEDLSNALEFAKTIERTLSEYGIKDNEELDRTLEYTKKLIKAYENGSWKKEKQELKTERDTWKRACELACGTIISEEIDGEDLYDVIEKWKVERDIEMYGFDDRFLTDYFYQQAKKEKEKN